MATPDPAAITRADWRRPRPDAAGIRRDVVLAVAMALLSVVAVQLTYSVYPSSLGWRGIEGYLWAVTLSLILALRRVLPEVVMVIACLMFFGMGERLDILSGALTVQVTVFMAIYAAWAWSRTRRLLLWVSVVTLAAMGVWVVFLIDDAVSQRQPETSGWFDPSVALAVNFVVVNALYFFGGVAWGLVSWRKAREHALVQAQAAQLERERDLKAERAVADERLRIARDLHDVVAHHVSSIGVHAAGARRLLARDPERSATALETIEESSRQAVQEMQKLVAMLRLDDARPAGEQTHGRAPQPGLDQLDDLAEQARAEGQHVTVRRTGEAQPVSSSVGLSLYRVVQESLSNSRKYAPGSPVDVVLRHTDGRAVEVEVLDDGPEVGQTTADDEHEGGWGLVGIRERAAMHGGSTEIGPRPERGFRVRVRLPIGGDA